MNASFKNIFKASGAASLGQVLNIANQLILVPLYIKTWGASLYGEWLVLSAAPSVIAMAGDLGFGTVAANEMNIAVARQNKTYALQVFQNNWLVITAFSLVVFGALLGLTQVVAFDKLLHIAAIDPAAVRAIVLIFVFNLLLTQQNGLLLAALRCDGNYVTGLVVGNISKILELALLAVLLIGYQASPLVIAGTIAGVAAATFVANRVLVRLRSAWIGYGFRHFSLALIREQVPIALSFLSFPITQALSIQGVVLLIGYLMGPVYVVIFSTTRTFMNVVKQVVSVTNASIWPELTTAYGQDDMEKFRMIFVRSVQFVVLAVVGFNLGVLVLGKPLYLLWTKHKIAVPDHFFYIFGLITSISALWNIFGMVQGATNRTKRYAVYNLASIAIVLIGILFMGKFLKLNGVIIAMFLSELFMLVFVVRDSLRILQAGSFYAFARSLVALRPARLKVF